MPRLKSQKQNVSWKSFLSSNDDVIHVPPTLQTAEATSTTSGSNFQETLNNLERELILDALKSSRGNQTKAAQTLGLTERLMGLRVKKYKIDPKRFRTHT